MGEGRAGTELVELQEGFCFSKTGRGGRSGMAGGVSEDPRGGDAA